MIPTAYAVDLLIIGTSLATGFLFAALIAAARAQREDRHQ